jgi:hypothetical protein
MPRCSAAGLDFRIIPAGFNAPLEFLTGFTDKVNYPPGNYKGIVALQVRNHPEIIPQLMVRLKDYLSSYSDMNSYKGKLVLVEVSRIRIR